MYELGIVADLKAHGIRVLADPTIVVLFGCAVVGPVARTYRGVTVIAPFYVLDTGEQVVAIHTTAQR